MMAARSTRAFVLLASMFAIAAVPAASNRDLDEIMSADGLQKTTVKGIALVYALPGATLADYDQIKLPPVAVSFRKDFAPSRTGSRAKLSTEELEKIRTGVGELVHEEFVKALRAGDGYAITDEAGPKVLEFRSAITNLYVNAPDTMSAGRSRTYTVNAGEMTLVAELVDSETGAVLARLIDRREARDTGTMTWSNSVTNMAEARNIARRWAKIFKERLDAAHAMGK